MTIIMRLRKKWSSFVWYGMQTFARSLADNYKESIASTSHSRLRPNDILHDQPCSLLLSGLIIRLLFNSIKLAGWRPNSTAADKTSLSWDIPIRNHIPIPLGTKFSLAISKTALHAINSNRSLISHICPLHVF